MARWLAVAVEMFSTRSERRHWVRSALWDAAAGNRFVRGTRWATMVRRSTHSDITQTYTNGFVREFCDATPARPDCHRLGVGPRLGSFGEADVMSKNEPRQRERCAWLGIDVAFCSRRRACRIGRFGSVDRGDGLLR